MKKTIKAAVIAFAQEELAEMIPPDTLARIKASDPNPQFKAFAVAHEGEASAEVVGTGKSSILRYFREAIYKIGNALGFGTKAFYRHEGNDGSGNNQHRETIGELVGKTFREIGGKLHAIAAFYIYPKHAKRGLNAASYEAEIEMSEQDGGVQVDNVAKITGVALSDMDRPGFPGATLMATMQAFSAKKGVQHMEELTLSQVKGYIRANNVVVTDIYSRNELLEQVKEWKDATGIIKKLQETVEQEKEAHLKTKETLQAEVGKLKNEGLAVKAAAMLDSVGAERKLSKEQLAFAKRNIKDHFKSTADDEEGLKNDIQKYIDESVKGYDALCKDMGWKPEEHGGTGAPQKDENNEQRASRENGGRGAGSGDGQGSGKDMTDPKHNDLIPA